MPRPPDGVTTVAVCANRYQADALAKHYDCPGWADGQLDLLGEDTQVVRVLPIGGEWHVQLWNRQALLWDAQDAADVPWTAADLQTEANVSFP
jgi:hypothetical protein